MARRKDPGRLVWIDLEMTGLDPEKHVIIEIACLVTDGDLNVLAEGPNLAISRTEDDLAQMDAWNVATHTRSGLIDRIKNEGVTIEEAERQTLAFVRRWVAKRMAPLAGNSIGQDRRFLVKEMPRLEEYLHYRNVDVSTIKELAKRWYRVGPTPPEKKQAHQALDDIVESVEELRWYREHYFRAVEDVAAEAPPAPEAGSEAGSEPTGEATGEAGVETGDGDPASAEQAASD